MERLFPVDAEQLDFENQHAVGLDRRAGWVRPVGQVAGHEELPLVADFHFLQCLGPAGDHAVDGELGRLAAVGAVELRAVEQRAAIVATDFVGERGRRAGALLEDFVLQAARVSFARPRSGRSSPGSPAASFWFLPAASCMRPIIFCLISCSKRARQACISASLHFVGPPLKPATTPAMKLCMSHSNLVLLQVAADVLTEHVADLLLVGGIIHGCRGCLTAGCLGRLTLRQAALSPGGRLDREM